MTADTEVRPQLSSYCRRAAHQTCKSVQARCACSCHGGVQMPPAPARRIEPRQPPAAATPPPVTQLPVLPDGIVWEEPEPTARGRHADPIVTADVLTALRAHPGKWAKVKLYKSKSGAHSAAGTVNAKAKRRLGPGWEAAARASAGGSLLYLRYTGDTE